MLWKNVVRAGVAVFALALLLGSAVAYAGSTQRFVVSIDNLGRFRFTDSGVFNTPVGSAGPGALLPGNAYEWRFHANPGERLSFASMFVQSNDWFFAPDEQGIPLYDEAGLPMSGDVTRYVGLWDAGTEVDQEPGSGADQAPRQAGPDSGAADPTAKVRRVLHSSLPGVDELVRVTLQPSANGAFLLRLENISGSSSLPTPLAPGVGVVHSAPAPLFINWQADWGLGLEALAEDGDPSGLAAALSAETGINTPLAPAAWVVDAGSNALFTPGAPASPGLESLAEDGSPAALVGELAGMNSGAAAIGRGAFAPAPIFAPDGNYSFEISAAPGDKLSLATMFVQSNDWFFALHDLPLFDGQGNPLVGDVTNHVMLWNAGTEVDEAPGFGPNQAPRQAAPNTGLDAGNVVHAVTDGHYADPAQILHITVTPID